MKCRLKLPEPKYEPNYWIEKLNVNISINDMQYKIIANKLWSILNVQDQWLYPFDFDEPLLNEKKKAITDITQ